MMSDAKHQSPAGTETKAAREQESRKARYFERPQAGEKPIGFLRLLVILISTHIGVRSRVNREEDFRRANGLHVFIAGVIYFLLIIGGLILLVNRIVR